MCQHFDTPSMRNAALGDRETFEERVKTLTCNN